jgi:hypothetical protein
VAQPRSEMTNSEFKAHVASLSPLDRYKELGAGVHTFVLEESVETLLREPQIYVRGGRGWKCLEGADPPPSAYSALI